MDWVRIAIRGASVCGLIYLLGAFSAASFDITAWSEPGRLFAALLMGLACWFSLIFESTVA